MEGFGLFWGYFGVKVGENGLFWGYFGVKMGILGVLYNPSIKSY
jgi:hypothetical protein